MDFLTLAEARYSCRKFDGRPLADADVEKILKAAILAPTAVNNQPQKIFVLRSAAALEKLRRCTACHFDAPVVFLVCYDTKLNWVRPFDGKTSGEVDASIVATHMMLEAAELGVGSTWVMFFDPNTLIREFDLPSNLVPCALLPMGYPAAEAAPSERHGIFRETSELVVEL